MVLKIPNVRKLYSLLAINFLNIAVIFFVLNLMALAGIKLWKAIYPPYYPTQSLKALQVVYPNMLPSDISLLLDETWNRQPWEYEAFVGFRERPRNGKFVNISKEGFRYSHIKDLSLDSKGLNIYVFGGSTTFGYGVDDASTIPSHIQKYLSKLYPDKNINVFNFGRAYYNSTQELSLLLKLIRNQNVPDIAIFIDGLNEGQKVPYFTREMRKLFKAYNYDKFERFRIFISKLSLMRVANKLMYDGTDNQDYRTNMVPEDTVKTYLTNKKTINSLSNIFNFKTYFFIQPIPGYRNNFLNHIFMPNDISTEQIQNEMTVMKMLEKTVNNKTSFSLTYLLENYEKQPFVDDVHYTSEVCKLIAANIIQKIKIPQ